MSIKRTGRYNDDVPAMEAEIERLTAENERLLRLLYEAPFLTIDAAVAKQAGDTQALIYRDMLAVWAPKAKAALSGYQQLSVREQAMQELADQAQELKMGYEQPVNSEEGK